MTRTLSNQNQSIDYPSKDFLDCLPLELISLILGYIEIFDLWRLRSLSRRWRRMSECMLSQRLLFGSFRIRISILHVQDPIILKCTSTTLNRENLEFHFEPESDSKFMYQLSHLHGPPSKTLYIRKCEWLDVCHSINPVDPFLDYQLNVGGDLLLKTTINADNSVSAIRLQSILNYEFNCTMDDHTPSRYRITGSIKSIDCSSSFLLQLIRRSQHLPYKNCEPICIYGKEKFDLLRIHGRMVGLPKITLNWLLGVVFGSDPCPLRKKMVDAGIIKMPENLNNFHFCWVPNPQVCRIVC